jgi:hypothetical protein
MKFSESQLLHHVIERKISVDDIALKATFSENLVDDIVLKATFSKNSVNDIALKATFYFLRRIRSRCLRVKFHSMKLTCILIEN